jgi:hypothetical protein
MYVARVEAPEATTQPGAATAVATAIQPSGTAVASPASTSIPDSTPENATPDAALPDVTLADNSADIAMHVGQSFLLNLGSDGWSVTVRDQRVISRMINIAVVRGAQGVYLAHAPGQTTLDAIGPSPCPNAVPACEAPQRVFRITIVVT